MESHGQDPTRNQSLQPVAPGDLRPLDDRYRVEGGPIMGGMGVVFKAIDVRLGRLVAIKRIRSEFATDQALVSRFLKEARTMAKFSHPNIVQILELAEDSLGPFIVMEWIEGQTVADVLKKQEKFDFHRALKVIQQIAIGLQVAHDAGVIHRDVKPANILLDTHDRPYIMDFGLVRIESESQVPISETVTGALLGTIDFVSPEQLKDPRLATFSSDIWSLAATLYQMLTGFSVRARDDELVPEIVRGVLIKALKPVPVHRYATMTEFADALHTALQAASKTVGDKPQGEAIAPAAATSGASQSHDTELGSMLRVALEKVQQTHARAKQMVEQTHQYADAVQLLDDIPEHLRDAALYTDAKLKRDRVATLYWEIRQAVDEIRLEGLGAKITELLKLQPHRKDMQRLREQLPKDVLRPARPALLFAPFDARQAKAGQEAWAKHLGIGVEVTNSLGMKFRVIPPGTFEMGSPQSEPLRKEDESLHTVTITQPKLLGMYPVTQGEWTKLMGSNPSHFKIVKSEDTSRFPVESVSWDDCQEFLKRLNSQQILKGWRYRLPTEAEWEYACRAGTVSTFWFGSKLNGQWANCDGNYPSGTSKGPHLQRPGVVGSYGANPFGLSDQHGNIWEWCSDWYDESYYLSSPSEDPSGPSSGPSRVVRGGSWNDSANGWRSANRNSYEPSNHVDIIGFRVLCELTASGSQATTLETMLEDLKKRVLSGNEL